MDPLDSSKKSSPRDWLVARQAVLLAEIQATERAFAGGVDGVGEATDLKEQANRHEQDVIQDAEVQRDRDELMSVRAALARLDEGSFGICVDCGQDIDAHRLEAMPAAARCIECQSRIEAIARAIPH